MQKKFQKTIAIAMLVVMLAALFSGCDKLTRPDGDSLADKNVAGNEATDEQTEAETNPIDGEDAFGGERFTEMIWGHYKADGYKYSGSNDDTKEFREEMEFLTLDTEWGEVTISALPVTMQAGTYAHFVGTFSYENEYYEPYTEKGKAMFRKAYIAEVGDMTEEQFQKIEAILDLDVVSVTMTQENGALQTATFAYTLDEDRIGLHELTIDDDYNLTISEEPFVQYYFLHDGGKLTLRYEDVQRDYIANGMQETDNGLSCSGYALDDKNKYEDVDGFTFFNYGTDDDFTVYVDLENGDSPIDPTMDFDFDTGAFTIAWEQVWHTDASGLTKVAAAEEISGTLIPCTSYGFTDYEGFILLIDGECYRYQMSQQEYEERKFSDVLGDASVGDISDSKLEEIETTKRNILEELKKALDDAGIEATIDTVSGKVALEANFLFATNSSEVSEDGKDYINRFIDAYTSVVLGDSYAEYIANIVIEGHTDTSGSYSLNQTLSEERASAVAECCISRSPTLESVIQTKGCSYDYPVYNEDGTVNMEKSRRVTFRFVFADV